MHGLHLFNVDTARRRAGELLYWAAIFFGCFTYYFGSTRRAMQFSSPALGRSPSSFGGKAKPRKNFRVRRSPRLTVLPSLAATGLTPASSQRRLTSTKMHIRSFASPGNAARTLKAVAGVMRLMRGAGDSLTMPVQPRRLAAPRSSNMLPTSWSNHAGPSERKDSGKR